MLKRPSLSAVSLLFAATMLTSPFGLHAAESKQIARSSNLGIELFGVGGDDWCKADSQLTLTRTNDSPLVGTEEKLFPKIARIFNTECPQMETAQVVVNDASGATTRDFRISKKAGWNIVEDAPAKTAQAETPSNTLQDPPAQPAPTKTQESPQPPKKQEPTLAQKQAEAEPEQKTAPAPAVAKEKYVSLSKDNLFWLAAHEAPELLEDNRVIDQLATLKSCDRFLSVRNNEFALRDWRQEVKPTVVKNANAASDLFEFSFDFRVDRNYNFDTAMLDIGSFTPKTQQYRAKCGWQDDFRDNTFGGRVDVSFEGLPDSFNRKIYLPDDLGRAAVDRLEATGNKVRITYRARLKGIGVSNDWGKRYELKAEFIDVKIHTGEHYDYLLVHHDADKFSAAREQHKIAREAAAEEQRKIEQERLAAQSAREEKLRRLQIEQENARAQDLYESLAGNNAVPAKLAALYHDGNPAFNNPYDVAARAISVGQKFPVRAFVRAGSRDSIGYRAEWPSRVYLTGSDLEEGEWYFVSGMGDGQKIDNTLLSIITVDEATKCDDRLCMSEDDVIDYVRSQYPQWTGKEE